MPLVQMGLLLTLQAGDLFALDNLVIAYYIAYQQIQKRLE